MARLLKWLHGPRFAAAAWIAAVAATAWLITGDTAWRAWSTYAVGLGGAGALLLLGAWWTSRFTPTIMVARFAAAGPNAEGQAEEFRSRVMSALASAVRALPAQPSARIRTLHEMIDANDDDQRQWAVSRAWSARCAVVVVGAVRYDDAELTVSTAVLTAKSLQRNRPDVEPARTILRMAPPDVVGDAKRTTAEEAARLAQLALGVAFLNVGRFDDADRVFASIDPATALALFFRAYTAFLRDDFATAARLAHASIAIQPWVPAIAVAAYSLFELGATQDARRLVEQLNAPGVLPANGPPWDDNIRLLGALAATRSAVEVVTETAEALAASYARAEAQMTPLLDRMEQEQVYWAARGQYTQDDLEGALATLAPAMVHPTPKTAGLYAEVAAAAGHPDACRRARATRKVVRAGHGPLLG